MSNGFTQNGNVTMVKHITTILQGLIIMLLVFFGNSVIDNGKAIAIMDTKLSHIVESDKDHDVRIRVLEKTK